MHHDIQALRLAYITAESAWAAEPSAENADRANVASRAYFSALYP